MKKRNDVYVCLLGRAISLSSTSASFLASCVYSMTTD